MKLAPAFVSFILLFLVIAAGPATAHVVLNAPNGGELLEPGEAVTITWHDSVYHGDCDYDLWYSTSGDSGPWMVILEDRNFGGRLDTYLYEWTVPNTPSNAVRIRVRQDNLEDDYEDISDGNLTINGTAAGMTVSIEAEKDASLYEGDGSLANGSGSYLFTGATNLPPWGNKQINRVLEDFAPVEAAYAHVWTTTPGGAFTCYGSVLDNLSSDPTTVLPR